MSVHYPVHPPHSRDMIHVEPSFVVCRRRNFPNLVAGNKESKDFVSQIKTLVAQFAFDDPPFIPDAKQTKVTNCSVDGPLPVLEYRAWNLKYSLHCACQAIDSRQNLIAMQCEVKNEGKTKRKAFVTLKFNICKEKDIFEYHYVHYYWNADKWLSQPNLSFENNYIAVDGTRFARVIPSGFELGFESSVSSNTSAFNQAFNCSDPYWIEPQLRVVNTDNVLRFSADIEPGQSKNFTVLMLSDEKNITTLQMEALSISDFSTVCSNTLSSYKEETFGKTSIICPYGDFDDIIKSQQFQVLQLMIDVGDGEPGLKPTQGGTSERFYVWIWEAMHMLKPMLRMGYFELVKKALDNIFYLQDAGCPPEGEFQTTVGSVGTTGPKWANSTGAALDLAASYYLYSKDNTFLEEFMPKLIKAADWIVGEIKATRRIESNGQKAFNWGLMPYARATDGDRGYVVAKTDVISLLGLECFVDVLEKTGHPDAEKYRKEAAEYRSAIKAVIPLMTRENGFIERHLPVPDQDIRGKFTGVGGGLNMAYANLLSDEQLKKYFDVIENEVADNFALFPMEADIVYTTSNEHIAQIIYLRSGQWKKAFATLRMCQCCALAKYTWLVSERFSKINNAYTPWQPNGSGSGRMIDMILNSICFELNEDELLFFGCMPYEILQKNGLTQLEMLHTQKGKLSLIAEAFDNSVEMKLSFENISAIPEFIKFPSHMQVSSSDAEKIKDNVFRTNKNILYKFSIIQRVTSKE